MFAAYTYMYVKAVKRNLSQRGAYWGMHCFWRIIIKALCAPLYGIFTDGFYGLRLPMTSRDTNMMTLWHEVKPLSPQALQELEKQVCSAC